MLTQKVREVCGAEPEQHRPQRVHVGLQEQRPLGGMAARPEHESATGFGKVGDRVEQPGLADAADALDEDEVSDAGARVGPELVKGGELALAPHEGRTLGPPPLRLVLRLAGQRLLAEDREMKGRGLGSGIDPELLAQPTREVVVRR